MILRPGYVAARYFGFSAVGAIRARGNDFAPSGLAGCFVPRFLGRCPDLCPQIPGGAAGVERGSERQIKLGFVGWV